MRSRRLLLALTTSTVLVTAFVVMLLYGGRSAANHDSYAKYTGQIEGLAGYGVELTTYESDWLFIDAYFGHETGECAFAEWFGNAPLNPADHSFTAERHEQEAGDWHRDTWITGSFPSAGHAAGTVRVRQWHVPASSADCDTGTVNWSASVTAHWTPEPELTPTPTPTTVPTPTASGATPGPSPTPTPTPTPTSTPTPTPMPTPTPTASGKSSPTATPTPIPEESAAGAVGPGGTLTTDTEDDGTTPADPVETWVTSPSAGTVTIDETAISGVPPSGFSFLGQTVTITAPAATSDSPLVIALRIDGSLVPPGEGAVTVRIYKNGAEVHACSGVQGQASPDPCVASRVLAGGDVHVTILTSSASDWDVGVADRGNVNCDGQVNAVDALFVLRYVAGMQPFASCIHAGDVNCMGGITAVDALGILRHVAQMSPLPSAPGCPPAG